MPLATVVAASQFAFACAFGSSIGVSLKHAPHVCGGWTRKATAEDPDSAEMASNPRKPQPTTTSLSLSPPAPTLPPTAMTLAELQPAIAALAAKKQRLRESFDRLAACSPVPIPFRWEDLAAHLSSVETAVAPLLRQLGSDSIQPESATGGTTAFAECVEHRVGPLAEDLDAHLSSVETNIAARLQQLGFDSLHTGSAAGGMITFAESVEQPVEHLAAEGFEPHVERGAVREGNAGDGEEAEDACVGQEREAHKGELGGASDGRRIHEGGGEAGNKREEGTVEVSLEQDQKGEVIEDPAGESMAASSRQCDGLWSNAEQEGEDDESEEEGEFMHPRPRIAAVADRKETLTNAIVAACTKMDASALVDVLCHSCRKSSLRARRAFLPALLVAADPHALVVRAVAGFLARPGSMTHRSWGNCVALVDCVPRLTGPTGPSVDTLEQAERLAWDWKGMMVGKTGRCRDMSRLAGWGLFTFLASYNIALEFEADEIIRLFDNLPPQLKENCIGLCKNLGLIEKMTDSIHCLIGNRQSLDAMRLACTLNLTDKCSPLSIMYDYVEKAKNTAQEILSKESDSAESLNQAMQENVNALMLSWRALDECNIDSVHSSGIKEEIRQLLHKYVGKQQSLSGVSTFDATLSQQQSLQELCPLQLQMAQAEGHQQRKTELQQNPGGKGLIQQHRTHKSQQKQRQNQQEQCWRWQNSSGGRPNKNHKRKQHRQKWQDPQQQFNKRPRYSGVRGVPIAERAKLQD